MVNLLNFLQKNRANEPSVEAGPRSGRRAVLRALLERREGLTADELAAKLSITRSAVHQQIVGLERDRLVDRRTQAKGRGRPGHVFIITDEGVHEFPKHYDWFAGLLLEALTAWLDPPALRAELDALGRKFGEQIKSQSSADTKENAIEALAEAMSELGYVARARRTADGAREIQAFNCVYHHLAAEHPEVCEFDLALLEAVTGERPEHAECMVRGGNACRFLFKNTAS